MTNKNAVDTSIIKQGDRVLVSGGTCDWPEPQWGTVGYELGEGGPKVYLDNPRVEDGKAYFDMGNNKALCYYAWDDEIIEHIPANKAVLPEPTREEIASNNVPKPLTAHDDIQATLDFLQATTGKSWEARSEGVQIDTSGAKPYGGEMMIRFVEKGKQA